jgi:SAM-dependent methyltransferase
MKAGQTNGFSLLVRDFIGNALDVARAVDCASPRVSKTLFFPGVFDMAADVRQHYDAKMARFTRQEESKSGMIRKYNNQVKSAILNQFVPQRAVVLDLACGHGQDLLKFRNKAPKLYVGTDIAQAALNEAQRRYRENRLSYPAQFIPGNLRLADVYQSIMEVASAQGYPDTAVFDTVSMQLAIHYLIGSRDDANEFLSRVARMMKSGGQFIVTLPCCDRIANRLRSINPENIGSFNSFEFGNELYNVSFITEELVKLIPELTQSISDRNMDAFESALAETDFDEVVSKASTTWGVKYMFWLVDTIERQEEYLVPMESLSQVALECGLSVELSRNFAEVPDLFPDSASQSGPGGRRQTQTVVLSDVEEEVSNIYRAVVFKKL